MKKTKSITVLFKCIGHEQDVAQWAYGILDLQTVENLLNEKKLVDAVNALSPIFGTSEVQNMSFYGCVSFINAMPKPLLKKYVADERGIISPLSAAETKLLTKSEDARMELEREYVDEEGIWWSAVIKHTNDTAETHKVPWAWIEAWYKELT